MLVLMRISGAEREDIIRQLEQLQTWKVDDDGTLKIKPKEEIKSEIGCSPDWRDLFLMRSWFDYNEYEIPDDIERRLGL